MECCPAPSITLSTRTSSLHFLRLAACVTGNRRCLVVTKMTYTVRLHRDASRKPADAFTQWRESPSDPSVVALSVRVWKAGALEAERQHSFENPRLVTLPIQP